MPGVATSRLLLFRWGGLPFDHRKKDLLASSKVLESCSPLLFISRYQLLQAAPIILAASAQESFTTYRKESFYHQRASTGKEKNKNLQ